MKCNFCGSDDTKRVMAHPMDEKDHKYQFFCNNCNRYYYQNPVIIEE